MADQDETRQSLTLKRVWGALFGLANSDVAALLLEAWHLIQKISTERAVGLYEVLDFEQTLELLDAKGKKAIIHKRQKVRLLQDYVSSYVDQVWGRGEIFAEYRCSPGTPVDRYRDGKYWRVLISLREVRHRGDALRISIDRTVKNGFPYKTDLVDTVVRHRTRHFRIAVVFPKERHPREVALVEINCNRTRSLGKANTEILPDGRRKAFWETAKPTLFETYALKWTW